MVQLYRKNRRITQKKLLFYGSLIIIVAPIFTLNIFNSTDVTAKIHDTHTKFELHNIITTSMEIHQDSDFIIYGLNGSGTPSDPYRIENLSFAVQDYYSIDIAVTTKNFIIRNCSFGLQTWGIRIRSVEDSTVEICNNSFRGLYGIEIERSNNCSVWNNDVGTYKQALDFYDSDYANISSNICRQGIYVGSSMGVIVFNNTFRWATTAGSIYGMQLNYVSDSLILNNSMYNNQIAVSVRGGSDTLIQDNLCSENEGGMYFSYATNMSVIRNAIISTESYGMNFRDTCSNCTITQNIFINNGYTWSGITEARDDGGMTWYENYWSTWDGVGEYEIYSYPTPITSDPSPMIAEDSDGDGLDDYLEEFFYHTDKTDEDSDNDLLLDGVEVFQLGTLPLDNDTDKDGLGDGEEVYVYDTIPSDPDTDNDLLLDGEEILIYHTNPKESDTDNDEMDDLFEVLNGLNATIDDSDLDPDEDGLTNIYEYNFHTKPQVNDTDGDLLLDGEEVFVYFTMPIFSDTDMDDLGDGEEVLIYGTSPTNVDSDLDGLEDGYEVLTLTTNPLSADSDSDGMPDQWEVDNRLNPLRDDSLEDFDDDQLSNIDEYRYGTSPLNSDTDSDNWLDGVEIRRHRDPLDPTDFPLSADQLFLRIGCITMGVLAVGLFTLHIILQVIGLTWREFWKKTFKQRKSKMKS